MLFNHRVVVDIKLDGILEVFHVFLQFKSVPNQWRVYIGRREHGANQALEKGIFTESSFLRAAHSVPVMHEKGPGSKLDISVLVHTYLFVYRPSTKYPAHKFLR